MTVAQGEPVNLVALAGGWAPARLMYGTYTVQVGGKPEAPSETVTVREGEESTVELVVP